MESAEASTKNKSVEKYVYDCILEVFKNSEILIECDSARKIITIREKISSEKIPPLS